MRILGAALENDVHVAGLVHFLRLAEKEGHVAINLGPTVSIEHALREARRQEAEMVALSYRLTPAVAREIFTRLKEAIPAHGLQTRVFVFGGTPPVAEEARQSGIFAAVFSGMESAEEIRAFLRGETVKTGGEILPQTLAERVQARSPIPLLRHHFGLPSLEETVKGAQRIAETGLLDILSLGPDQNAQESFFRPEEMDPSRDGAGGVPLRKEEDLVRIYAATRCGNFPLLRCYAGTRDLIRWGELLHGTIGNAWGAVPIFWYSELDGRSTRPLRQAIEENLAAMRWHADHRVPLEINDVHQWSLRYAPDAVAVANAYLCAYLARSIGVKTYVAQYMFNTPPETDPVHDLGKMLAQKEMIEEFRDASFQPLHMVRAGLMSFSPDPAIAKGQLAASTAISLAIDPQIVHVVGYSEADHAVKPDELIESLGIAQGVLRNLAQGRPQLAADRRVQRRRNQLLAEARQILERIRMIGKGSSDPYLDPDVLARVVEKGILFAPHILNERYCQPQWITTTAGGCCRSALAESGQPISEVERLGEDVSNDFPP
jgi:methylmalonyl-CoA mutase cobalamin-binding subunit